MSKIADVLPNEVIDDEWGNKIRDHVVQVYESAADRTSNHGTPFEGQVSFLEDTDSLQYYASGAWRDLLPTGVVLPYAGTSAPAGFLLCNGAAVSRTTYAALFAVLGTTFGSGNGSTTFNLPDLRQRYPMGVAASGTGNSLGATFGEINHRHTGPAHTHTVNGNTQNRSIPHTHALGGSTGSGGSHSHTFSDTFTTSGPSSTGTVDTSGVFTRAQANHTHTGSVSGTTSTHSGHTHSLPANTGSSSSSTSHNHAVSITTSSAGTGNTGTANPPTLTLNFIVKT